MTGYFLLSRFRKRGNTKEKETQIETHKRYYLKQENSAVIANTNKPDTEHK